jgi:hypothetical protein
LQEGTHHVEENDSRINDSQTNDARIINVGTHGASSLPPLLK